MWRSRDSAAWVVALAGAVVALLAPALWNGFPFVFFDSAGFIQQALHGGFLADRSVFYAWFLKATGLTLGIWLPVVVQAILCVGVIAAIARREVPELSAGAFAIVVVVLCVFTALPWTVGQIMPDALTGVLVLSLYGLAFPGEFMRPATRVGLMAAAVIAITVHASHLGLAMGLSLAVAAAAVLHARWPIVTPAPRWRAPAAVTLLSIALIVASNFAHTGQVFLNRAGPAFLLGRLMENGLIKPVLDAQCGTRHYALCAYKDNLPKTANEWLWSADSPFKRFEGWAAYAPEAEHLIVESFKRDPVGNIATAVAATARQFVTIGTGDGFEAMGEDLVPTFAALGPDLPPRYRAARQQGRIAFTRLAAVHAGVAGLALVALLVAIGMAIHRRRIPALPVFVLLALLGNAFICGAFSGVHGRYQSRLAWTGVLAACLPAARGVRRFRQSTLHRPPMAPNDSPALVQRAEIGRT